MRSQVAQCSKESRCRVTHPLSCSLYYFEWGISFICLYVVVKQAFCGTPCSWRPWIFNVESLLFTSWSPIVCVCGMATGIYVTPEIEKEVVWDTVFPHRKKRCVILPWLKDHTMFLHVWPIVTANQFPPFHDACGVVSLDFSCSATMRLTYILN